VHVFAKVKYPFSLAPLSLNVRRRSFHPAMQIPLRYVVLATLVCSVCFSSASVLQAQAPSANNVAALLPWSGEPQITRLIPALGAEAASKSLTFGAAPRLANSRRRRSLLRDAGTGFLVGAGAGLVIGLALDSQGCIDCMMPATFTWVPFGAAVGTVTGGVLHLVRRP
jgi:hypothetical protein